MPADILSTATRAIGGAGVRLEIVEGGTGRPILFLHPGIGLRDAVPFLERLAKLGRVIAPAHPGFHGSELPAHFTSVDDISYLYLDLIARLEAPAVVVGASLGGWIALEMAAKSTQHMAGLVLVDSVGVRFNAREVQDFADIYALSRAEIDKRLYHDPARGQIDYPNTPQAELELIARNREAETRFSWSPYLHSPHLGTRLHRVDAPARVIWGESDGLAPPAYGKRLAEALPHAAFETIVGAGHFPHIEQPDELAVRVARFMATLPEHAEAAQRKEMVR
jgi:pimeloyl-ACP methyl ester carboxylesterase